MCSHFTRGCTRSLTVENSHDTDLDDGMRPGLDILCGIFHVFLGVVPTSTAVGLHFLGSDPHQGLVFIGQKIRRIEVLRDKESTACSPNDGDDTLDDV